MKIEKQGDGSTKLSNGDGENLSHKNGNDPVDATIDINLRFKQFSDDLMKRYNDDGMQHHMAFFIALSYAFGHTGWNNSPNTIIFESMIEDYNSFMLQHQIMGEIAETLDMPLPIVYKDEHFDTTIGKYLVSRESDVPQLLMKEPKTYEKFAEQLIACALLDYLYEFVDIREIENRIPELAGLCDYLKTLAPDEFHAYCILGDKVNLDSPFDMNGYYDVLKQLNMV